MFELTDRPIDSAALQARLVAPAAGAAVVFEGRVRNHHLGRPVTQLEYEAFGDMAQVEGAAIVEEIERLYPGTGVHCVHRTGTLAVGEIAVWIGVSSAHRQAGFAACRQVIEEIKLRLPVWKKEGHPDGAAEWVNCTAEARPVTATDYHARQIALPEVGLEGQAKLAAARVLIVGVGGLGCPAALYLAGAGVGHLTLVDAGKVELSNLHRQILFTPAEVGAPKTLAAAARLRLQHPGVTIRSHEGELTAANARALVAGQAVVLDCTDNFATRFVLHDACHALAVPLVQAAVHRFEGTLDVFRRGEGGCLHCLWPERSVADLATAGNCAGAAVFGPAVGVLGIMQAAETLKLLLGLSGAAATQTRLVNLLDGTAVAIERPIRRECPLCAQTENLAAGSHHLESDSPSLFIAANDLFTLGPTARVAFLTEPGDHPAPTFPIPFLAVPAYDLATVRELANVGPVVLACRYGLRSAAVARLLRAEGLGWVQALQISSP